MGKYETWDRFKERVWWLNVMTISNSVLIIGVVLLVCTVSTGFMNMSTRISSELDARIVMLEKDLNETKTRMEAGFAFTRRSGEPVIVLSGDPRMGEEPSGSP